jgi:hypothetical protein
LLADWKSYLKADVSDWLLEEDNPSVRYFTLTEIWTSPRPMEKRRAKTAIMEGVVPKILAKQNSDGTWETPTAFYTAKYRAHHGNLLF